MTQATGIVDDPTATVETLGTFAERIAHSNKTHEDVKTWFDLLNLDDHVTFGGMVQPAFRVGF